MLCKIKGEVMRIVNLSKRYKDKVVFDNLDLEITKP